MKNFSSQKLDRWFMQEALLEAKKAFLEEEVPVGAVIVRENLVIGAGHNRVESLKDATAHAEILALKSASQSMGDWRLLDTTLYVTLEPCVMCAGAIMQSRVKRVVFGAKDLRLGANGSFVDLFKEKHPMHQVVIEGGVLAEESSVLLKTFFQKRRSKKI
ncbi:MAG: tRNA adenosine(34) deaminase TadA [Chlamydiota bacterium]